MKSSVWLVGQWKDGDEAWEVRGVFTSARAAVAVCEDDLHFVMHLPLGEDLGSPSQVHRETWYPAVESREEGMARAAAYAEEAEQETDVPYSLAHGSQEIGWEELSQPTESED